MKALIIADISAHEAKEMERFADIVTIPHKKDVDFTQAEVVELLLKHRPDVFIVDATPIRSDVLSSAPFLKMIICTRGNPVNIDAAYCKANGIILCNTPARNANAVAEFAVAMIINLFRRIPEAYYRLKNGEFSLSGDYRKHISDSRSKSDVIWRDDRLELIPYFEFQGKEIARKRLGLVGLGAVGKLVAQKCAALDMDVVAYDPYYKPDKREDIPLVGLEELASTSDVISLHAKETPETEGMIGEKFFRMVKRGSYLVNTARGRLIDREALLDALENGVIAAAALDVFDYEPLCSEDPLLKHPKIICTPHIGGASVDVISQHSRKALESFVAFVKGTDIPYRIV